VASVEYCRARHRFGRSWLSASAPKNVNGPAAVSGPAARTTLCSQVPGALARNCACSGPSQASTAISGGPAHAGPSSRARTCNAAARRMPATASTGDRTRVTDRCRDHECSSSDHRRQTMHPRPTPYAIRFVQFETRRREALERSLWEQARRAARLHPHLKPEFGARPSASDLARGQSKQARRAG
jgi:hypothetical protein